VLALVDGEVFRDAVRVGGIGIVPAGLEFLERDRIGAVTVDLVRGHVDEWSLRACAAGGLEHVEGADGIGIEVVEGDRCSAVVAGLGGGVNDGIRLHLSNQIEDALAVADIELMMNEPLEIALKTLLIPTCVSLRTKKDSALIVIDPMNLILKLLGKIVTNLGTDQARGSGD